VCQYSRLRVAKQPRRIARARPPCHTPPGILHSPGRCPVLRDNRSFPQVELSTGRLRRQSFAGRSGAGERRLDLPQLLAQLGLSRYRRSRQLAAQSPTSGAADVTSQQRRRAPFLLIGWGRAAQAWLFRDRRGGCCTTPPAKPAAGYQYPDRTRRHCGERAVIVLGAVLLAAGLRITYGPGQAMERASDHLHPGRGAHAPLLRRPRRLLGLGRWRVKNLDIRMSSFAGVSWIRNARRWDHNCPPILIRLPNLSLSGTRAGTSDQAAAGNNAINQS
jgi:hypothetical protein